MHNISSSAPAQANAAIDKYLGMWWRDEKAEAIKAEFGWAVYQLVWEAYQTAVNTPVNWEKETLETATQRVLSATQEAHPWLTKQSLLTLGNCFAYAWR
ncbi:hypothetical protein [Hymenobacter latericus]|uniref:hypothetical protein n=1 Tax=Hymenobacter sp. YIM 151858-1 TaxID=2987688 RepID=UPI00222784EB|nr:hypothetical protein [Hymenobacter sp. YIM 151858-1]UYZ58230.1 hypothetical protein OIS50_14335 [Hymenobacter sp. YIM 151858-1]